MLSYEMMIKMVIYHVKKLKEKAFGQELQVIKN